VATDALPTSDPVWIEFGGDETPSKRLDGLDLRGLLTFGAGFHLKGHTLLLLKGFETLGVDFRKMDKEIITPTIGGDKAKAL
jgi:hypothetical protein